MQRNLFQVVGLKLLLPTIFLLGCGSTDVSESNSISVSLTPTTTAVTQSSIINGYPIELVVSRNGSVVSSVDNGIVNVLLTDPTTGCGGSGTTTGCLRLQAAAGSNAATVNSYAYTNGKATIYVGAHASVAQGVSISAVTFTVAASVAVSGVQASNSIRVAIQ